MCYSAMVQQDADKLGIPYHARIQYDIYRELFSRRMAGEKLAINKAMEYQFTKNPKTPVEKQIKKLIIDWHEKEVTRLETEIFKQKKRNADAERALKVKETKKASEDLRISATKIEKAKADLKKHGSVELKTESDSRIYPYHYFSMLYVDDGKIAVRPFRYHMRPHGKDSSFDREFNGCYNARFNNLKRVDFWKDSLAKRRGLMVVERFYENVSAKDYAKNHKIPKEKQGMENLVLCFEPDNKELMLIPTLWDINKQKGEADLYSAALITDDPLPEIAAAGHDRTPIFLERDAVNAWLFASSMEEAVEALGRRVRPSYSHRLVGSAAA